MQHIHQEYMTQTIDSFNKRPFNINSIDSRYTMSKSKDSAFETGFDESNDHTPR